MKQHITWEELNCASEGYRYTSKALDSIRKELSMLLPIIERLADFSNSGDLLSENQAILNSLHEIGNKLQSFSDYIDRTKEDLMKLVPPEM